MRPMVPAPRPPGRPTFFEAGSRAVAASLLAAACTRGTPAPVPPPVPWVARAEATARTETLTPQDVVALRGVRDVAIRPGGDDVVYVLRVPAPLPEKGRPVSGLWRVAVGGERPPQRLTAPGHDAAAPAYSPDGRYLAFLGRRNGDTHRQVYVLPTSGGEPVAATAAEAGVRTFRWAPDGKSIAYVAAVPTEEAEERRKSGRDALVDEPGGDRGRLYLVPFDPAAEKGPPPAREVVEGGHHVIDLRFFPRGDRLLVRASDKPTIDHEMMYSRLYTVPAAGGPLSPLTETAGKLGDMAVSPDGGTVAFLGAFDLSDSTSGVVYVVPAAGGTKRALTADAPMTAQQIFFRDNRTLLVLAVEDTTTAFYEVPLAGGPPRRRLPEAPVCHRAALEGRTVACAASRPDHPPEVYAGRTDGRDLRRLTASNPHLAGKRLGEQRVFRYRASDGMELAGILTLPVGYEDGRRYPLAVLPHGGPEGVSLHDWRTRATYPVQILATAGYVVFEPNYRGSAGRGHRFAKADHRDLGGREFVDVLDGIDALADKGIIDPERVGMAGWSYGGYFSALAATRYSERFRAAMIGAAVTDWVSFTGTTEIEHENSLVHWNLWPWDDLKLAWDRSPIAHVDGSKTAALVVHGLADTRVPPGQGLEIYRALRHEKVPTQLVLYPREPHGLVENVHSLDFIERLVGWFDRYVKQAADGDAS